MLLFFYRRLRLRSKFSASSKSVYTLQRWLEGGAPTKPSDRDPARAIGSKVGSFFGCIKDELHFNRVARIDNKWILYLQPRYRTAFAQPFTELKNLRTLPNSDTQRFDIR